MSKPKQLWWAYAKNMVRTYKRGGMPEDDRAAVEAAIKVGDVRVTDARHFGALKRFVKMLVLGKWIQTGTSLEKTIDEWKGPPKPTAPNLRDI